MLPVCDDWAKRAGGRERSALRPVHGEDTLADVLAMKHGRRITLVVDAFQLVDHCVQHSVLYEAVKLPVSSSASTCCANAIGASP